MEKIFQKFEIFMGAKILRWNIAFWNIHVSKACFQHENQRGKWALLLYMAL